jgi:hypothetical protein
MIVLKLCLQVNVQELRVMNWGKDQQYLRYQSYWSDQRV